MKKKLSKKLYEWLGFVSMVSLVTAVVDVGLSLYIWDSGGDLSRLIWYHVAMFVAIPVVSLFSGLITDYINPRISLGISFFAYGILLFLAGRYADLFFDNLLWFGALAGAAIAMQATPLSAITIRNVGDEDRDRFASIRLIMRVIIGILLPILVAGVKKVTGELTLLFVGIAPIAGFVLLWLTKIKVQMPDHERFDFGLIFSVWKRNPDSRSLWLSDILMAMKDGVFWVLRNVLAYILLGSITYWGIFAVVTQLIKIAVSWWLSKKSSLVSSRAWFILSGFFYTASALILAIHFSIASFLWFSLVDAVFGVFTSIVFTDAILRMMEKDPLFYKSKLETEYSVLREFHLGIGRVLPLLLMGWVFVGLGDLEMVSAMKLVFILVGWVPQLLSFVMLKSKGFGELLPIGEPEA